ncbi:MAG: ribosome biogenesis GTPase Der [bacterium]
MANLTVKTYPKIALVGRTNVGKSTLFNKLIEEKKSLVSDETNTTRDRVTGICLWQGRPFLIIDTGGQDIKATSELEAGILRQAENAAKEADVIFFVIDGEVGVLPEDRALAKTLRQKFSKKPIVVVANKSERPRSRSKERLTSYRALGFSEIMPVSAKTGLGVGDALDFALKKITKRKAKPLEEDEKHLPLKISFVGRPNVGKSSILNSIMGEERCLVSPMPHTTREPNDIEIEWEGKNIILVDTAGLRRPNKVSHRLTRQGIMRTLETIKRSDVCFLVLDASEPPTTDDRHFGGLLKDTDKGIGIVVNKWDKIEEKTTTTINEYTQALQNYFPFLSFAPLIFVSAAKNQRTHDLIKVAEDIQNERKRIIDEETLMKFFREVISIHKPSRGMGPRHPYLYRIKQIGVRPPTFLLSIRGQANSLHFSYLRFLENQLRAHFGFQGTPIKIVTEEISMAPRKKSEKQKNK